MKKLLFPILCMLSILSFAQPTVGVITSTEDVLDGYTFFSPFSGTKAYLVDNCGNLVNEWDRGTRPGLSAYFLENGLMMRTYKIDPIGPFTSASNMGGIELVNWENEVVWNYQINTSEQLSHHDAVMMPNGNILILTWQLTYREELIELGRDPEEIAPQNFMWSEKILELEPVGTDQANIVWEWHINDHYVQDFDSTKVGYNVVANHPELFDINQPALNSGNSNATRDWNHFNAIDYNPALDQILISVRNSDEIWIIDHSTSTEEAAGHSGGKYGKGGDILYRWGNPSAYKAAPASDQMLWGQHGVNWIREGMTDAGQILIYNNGNGKPGQDFSQAQLLSPPQDSLGFYSYDGTTYGPESANTVYGNLAGENFYSAFLSNAQRLPNGNTLINAGSPGRIFEITPERKIAWSYEIPLFGDTPATQGQTAGSNANFRAYKFSSDFIGFEGLDLTPGQPIEINPLPCELTNIIESDRYEGKFTFDSSINSILFHGNAEKLDKIELINQQGQTVFRSEITDTQIEMRSNLVRGIYYIRGFSKDVVLVTQKLLIL